MMHNKSYNKSRLCTLKMMIPLFLLFCYRFCCSDVIVLSSLRTLLVQDVGQGRDVGYLFQSIFFAFFFHSLFPWTTTDSMPTLNIISIKKVEILDVYYI